MSSTLFAIGAYFIYSKFNVAHTYTPENATFASYYPNNTHKVDNMIEFSMEWVKQNKESILGGFFLLAGLLIFIYSFWSQNKNDYDEISGIPLKRNVCQFAEPISKERFEGESKIYTMD